MNLSPIRASSPLGSAGPAVGLALAALLSLGGPVRAVDAPALVLQEPQAPAASLDPAVEAELERALAVIVDDGADPWSAVEPLWRAAAADTGEARSLVDELGRRADEGGVDAEQARALRELRALLMRRRGTLEFALEAVDALLVEEEEPRWLLERARLLDATGDRAGALEAYRAALPGYEGGPREVELRLRMALLDMAEDEESESALADFARREGTEAALSNRAAVVLALLGRPEDAIELFVVDGEGTKRFRQEIRIAEWALQADDEALAQDWAWKARASAQLDRDRYYALTVLVQAHRADETLDALLERFADEGELDGPSRGVWIALLRETGRFDEAAALFRRDAEASGFPVEVRRELLEMDREAGREQDMVRNYRELIASDTDSAVWPEGLSRYYLERGEEQAARAAWDTFLAANPAGVTLLAGAEALMGLGQDDLAIACAERCIEEGPSRFAAFLFLFDLHRFRGDLAAAEAALERMDAAAPPEAPERMQLAESFERIGNLRRAVDVLEALREARGAAETGEDLEMRLAWLHSEVGDEEVARERWHELWLRVDSVPRRRYVEDRMMTVASRLGKLADLAIELESKLIAGTANDRESGLLVRLYTKVGDPVSATEVIEEHLKHSGGSQVEALQEKARVFLACTDYHNYEKTVRRLIQIDPEGEGDYLRQIAMSMLERGKPDQARAVLARLEELGDDSDSAEFEAGVLALAGLREEAIRAYRRGIAESPDRIESYLLMANLMRELGDQARAIGVFQHLAETAEKDDLFTIAIDGLLNMEAPAPVLEWARRITLERLARRHDKMYLYQLIADLAEQTEDMESRLAALEGSLPIAGDRRPSVVRELMDLAQGGRSGFGGRSAPRQPERHLDYGRRLIGLGQLVPPQVYLDLGQAFLQAGDVDDAVKTFRLARDLPDFAQFQRDTAALFEQTRYLEQALDTYRKVLIGDAGNISLLVKVGELREQLGLDDQAWPVYRRAVELLLARRPLFSGKEEEASGDPYARWFARNVDDFDRYFDRALKGLLVSSGPEQARLLIDDHGRLYAEELAQAEAQQRLEEEPLPLARYPRLLRRAGFLRRLALAFGLPAVAADFDLRLLAAFPDDDSLLESLVRERAGNGLIHEARRLMAASGRDEAALRRLRFLVGEGVEPSATDLVPVDETVRLLLPLLSAGRSDDVRELLRRTDYGAAKEDGAAGMDSLFSAALVLDDPDLTLFVGRHWLRVLLTGSGRASSWQLQPVLDRCTLALEGDHLRSLYQYFVQLVVEEPEQRGESLRLLPDLQERVGEPLMEPEQIADLLTEHGERLAFWIGPLLQLVPAGERASILSGVWPVIAPTSRPWFLINLVQELKDPPGEELEALVLEWFEEALRDAEDYLVYQLDSLTQDEVLKRCPGTVLRMLELYQEAEPGKLVAKVLRAKVLKRMDRAEEAAELVLEAYFDPRVVKQQDDDTWRIRSLAESEFFPDMPERFFARFAALDEEQGPELERTELRLNLARRLDDKELMLGECRAAVEAHPEELGLRHRLRSALLQLGRSREADEVFAAMIADNPEDQDLARSELSLWRSRKHALKAVAALDRLEALRAAEEAASGGPEEAPEEVEDEEDQRLEPAHVGALKEAVDEGRTADAAVLLRRMWRSYPRDDQPRYVVYSSSSRRLQQWPEDEVEPTEEQKALDEAEAARRRRGGMEAYREQEPEARERRSTWEVLAEHDFGVAEMERQLRLAGPAQLEAMEAVLDGLARARVLEHGQERAVRELLDRALAGEASKAEHLQLLALLEAHPEAVGEEARRVLDDLEGSLHPRDGRQLLRLARVMAATGERQRALDLYRWCATLASASNYFSGRTDDYGTLPVAQLVREVKETLDGGEDLVAVVEEVLRFSSPVRYPWERESYQRLVLDTWSGMLDPASALEHCREICAEADSRDQPLRRQVARQAALLYGQNAEFERAIACLEAAVCSFPADAFASDRYRWYGSPGWARLSTAEFRLFLPADLADWRDPAGWFEALGDALLGWIEDGRVDPGQGCRAVSLVAWRLHQRGEQEAARAFLERLQGMSFEDVDARLWLADALRRCGDEGAAHGIEADLLAAQRLNLWRLPDLVRKQLEREGPAAALAAGERLREHTLHPELLVLMVEAAAAAGDEPARVRWQELADQAEAATTRVDAWYEAERAEAEARRGQTAAIRIIR